MDYSLIVGPIVGAFVGGFTNFVAIKMLFWPMHEKRIGGIRIPFTPGLIPKEKDRIIEKIARTIGEDLLSSDNIATEVLNDDVRKKFVDTAIDYKNKMMDTEDSIADIINKYTDAEMYNKISEKGKTIVCKHIYDGIMEKNPSEMIINKVVEVVKEKLKGGLLSVVINDSFIINIAESFRIKIDKYLENDLYDFIYDKIENDVNNILEQKPSEFLSSDIIDDAMVERLVTNVFDEMIVPEVSKMITTVDISKVVTNKLNNMDIKELEDLLYSVMKKELGYIINFGFVIGFIIGLIGTLPIFYK